MNTGTTTDTGPAAGPEPADPRLTDLDHQVSLHALTFLDEGEEVTVGRQDIDSYCVLPADGAALLRELTRGVTPRAAAGWYSEQYGIQVNMTEFLEAMDELGFIAAAGETALAAAAPVRWQRLGQALFSRPAWAGYTALLAAAVVVMARHHGLVPQYRNIFFSPYIMVISLLLFFGQFPFIVLHELFHVLAGRRLGLRTRLTFGRRLYFVVVETVMDGLVTVPRRKRYLPILAGLLADLLVIAALTLIGAALRGPGGTEPLIGGICLGLAFATMLRFFWQFFFYLQTDIYLAIVTVLGCVDLQKTAKRMIANRVRRTLRLSRGISDESLMHPIDVKVARWYSWLLIAGYGFSLGTTLFIAVPTLIRICRIIFGRLINGSGDAGLADSALFLLVNVAQFAVIGYIMLRDRRQRRRTPSSSHLVG